MLNKFSMDPLANSLNQLPLISASSLVFIPDALDYHDQNRKDGLFFDAGTVILVLSESVQSACSSTYGNNGVCAGIKKVI
ncbi:hypothetical protein [Clostridium estertheticum]|uniref:hypothetical protein n=1 Tax=Clostridium estertheticum TaxID=238834 RepID=UPI001C7D623B|nr:hypothetical protein [Clostridium estertheticum]MBX4263755.1 hypothetical protein [Clostridium estertheticum]WLC87569.1 hypothetical protein KTC95_15740 [Clostridium estertheticum]